MCAHFTMALARANMDEAAAFLANDVVEVEIRTPAGEVDGGPFLDKCRDIGISQRPANHPAAEK